MLLYRFVILVDLLTIQVLQNFSRAELIVKLLRLDLSIELIIGLDLEILKMKTPSMA